jgi:hypothetical protein
MSGEELTGTQKAAALHGVAINVAYNFRERFDAALEALALYEQAYGELHAGHEAISGLDLGVLSAEQAFALGSFTGELMATAEASGKRQGLLQAVAALQNVDMLSDWIEVRGFDPNNPSYWMGERAVQMLAEYLESLMQTEGQ